MSREGTTRSFRYLLIHLLNGTSINAPVGRSERKSKSLCVHVPHLARYQLIQCRFHSRRGKLAAQTRVQGNGDVVLTSMVILRKGGILCVFTHRCDCQRDCAERWRRGKVPSRHEQLAVAHGRFSICSSNGGKRMISEAAETFQMMRDRSEGWAFYLQKIPRIPSSKNSPSHRML